MYDGKNENDFIFPVLFFCIFFTMSFHWLFNEISMTLLWRWCHDEDDMSALLTDSWQPVNNNNNRSPSSSSFLLPPLLQEKKKENGKTTIRKKKQQPTQVKYTNMSQQSIECWHSFCSQKHIMLFACHALKVITEVYNIYF